MHVPLWASLAVIGFILVVPAVAAVDVFAPRRAHVMKVKEAAACSVVWTVFGVGFGLPAWRFTDPRLAGSTSPDIGASLWATRGQERRELPEPDNAPFGNATAEDLAALDTLWTYGQGTQRQGKDRIR